MVAVNIVAMEEAAEVDALVFDSGEPDVSAVAEVEFQISGEIEVFDVHFEPDPRGGGIRSAAGGDNTTDGGLERLARVSLQRAARRSEGGRKTLIEGVSAEATGRLGQVVLMRDGFAAEPRDGGGGESVSEVGTQGKSIDGEVVERGDEFSADAMSGVVPGLSLIHI